MASHTASAQHRAPPGLATRSFARRVRALLQGIVDYSSDELEGRLRLALNEYETALQAMQDQARSSTVRDPFTAALAEFRRGRHLLLPAFRAELEGGVASLQEPVQASALPSAAAPAPLALSLSLVDDVVIDDAIVLREASNRAEVRSSLALYLLGQRMGVIAGRPAFDAATLPIGPQRLCEYFRRAVQALALGADHRHLLYKQFDRHVMQPIGPFYDALNDYLIGQRVLPTLTYVPFRARPAAQPMPAAANAGPDAAELGLETVAHEPVQRPAFQTLQDLVAPATDDASGSSDAPSLDALAALLSAPSTEPRPVTRWPGQVDEDAAASAAAEGSDALFDALCSLLDSRRSLVGKLGGKGRSPNAQADRIAEPAELQRALVRLQALPAVAGRGRPRPTEHVKQDLLAQLRLASPSGDASALADADDNAIDLVGLLLEHITRALRPGSPALPLLQRLQAPLLRVAVLDAGFFIRRGHPARQLLNIIADTCEFLSPTDAADRVLLDRMRAAVERAGDYQGDATLFAELCADLEHHLQAQARKADVTERRHVEAALGREKLEGARRRASEVLEQLMAGRRAPRFIRTLLTQAWADVLALALLRGGEDSERFQQQLRTAERLLVLAAERRLGRAQISPEEAQPLKEAVESALVQVGYHADDAQAVSARLVAVEEADDDDAASSTELALRLKQKVRLGAELAQDGLGAAALDEAACAQLARIGELDFGTWFEFRQPNGSVERRRLSWYSLATGYCLFVNHRGHKLADCSLRWLASEMADGRAAVLLLPDAPVVDRAWAAIMRALHSFADTNDRVPS
jgi:hypothetical protein